MSKIHENKRGIDISLPLLNRNSNYPLEMQEIFSFHNFARHCKIFAPSSSSL